LGFFGNFNF